MPKESFVDYSGQSIDDYQVDKLLIRHGQSARYLGRDSSNTPVIIEILNSTSKQDPALDGRFQQQMQTLMQHQHPGITAVQHVGHTQNSHAYAVSQYTAGPTLAQKLEKWRKAGTTIPVLDALQLVKHLAQALAVIHPLDIFHHDLRPEKVILSKNNIPVLIGLGLPYQAELQQISNQARTLDYAPPEQRQGKPINGSSNIYSLGVILYELLAGHRPEIPISSWHIFEITNLPKEVPLQDVRPGLAAATYELVNTCLWRQEWSRYKTIDQFLAAIDEAIAAETSPFLSAGTARFPRWLYLVPLGLILIVLAGFLLARDNSTPDAVMPLSETAVATPPPSPRPTETTSPTTENAAGAPVESSPTDEPQILLLAPESGVEVASDDTVFFDWNYPIPLASDQQFVVQIITEAGTQTVGTVTAPLSGQQYRLTVALTDWDLKAGAHQWSVTLENNSTSEELLRSEQQSLLIQAMTPTATLTSTLTSTPEIPPTQATPTPTATCAPTPPSSWVVYTIQEGDYLFNLALATGTTVERLQEVNCMVATGLGVGQRLWLPVLPPTATPTITPTPVSTEASSGSNGSDHSPPKPEKTPPPLPNSLP